MELSAITGFLCQFYRITETFKLFSSILSLCFSYLGGSCSLLSCSQGWKLGYSDFFSARAKDLVLSNWSCSSQSRQNSTKTLKFLSSFLSSSLFFFLSLLESTFSSKSLKAFRKGVLDLILWLKILRRWLSTELKSKSTSALSRESSMLGLVKTYNGRVSRWVFRPSLEKGQSPVLSELLLLIFFTSPFTNTTILSSTISLESKN